MRKNAIQLIYKISELASQDIDSIIEYTIENFSVDAMIDYHSSLENCFDTIAKNPNIGLESDVLIVRVLHNTMDVAR